MYIEQMSFLLVRVMLLDQWIPQKKRDRHNVLHFPTTVWLYQSQICNVQMVKWIELKQCTIIRTLILPLSLISNPLYSQWQESPVNPIRSLEVMRSSSRSKPEMTSMNPPILNHMSRYCEGTETTAVYSKSGRAANPSGVWVVSLGLWRGPSITIKAYWVDKSIYTHDGKHLLHGHKPNTLSMCSYTHTNTNNRYVATSNHKYTGHP